MLIVLAACGGGGGAGAGNGGSSGGGGQGGVTPPIKTPLATSASNWFPLDGNGVAVYASSSSPEPIIIRMSGTQAVADQQAATLMHRQDLKTKTASYRAYVYSEAGLRQYAAAGADAIERAFDGSHLIRFPAYAGDSFVQLNTTVDSGMDYDGDGRADRVSLRSDITVVGVESVTTPAGSFGNALHQQQVLKQTVHPSSGKAEQQLITTTDTWYAPGIGIVRHVQAEQGVGAGVEVSQSLTKYRFGTLTNDNDLPVLQTMWPASSSHVLANTKLGATFSEEMDEASFTAETFVVTGPDERPVEGSFAVEGRAVTFTPKHALPGGNYRVDCLKGVQDLFGRHPLNTATNFFFVDTTAPTVSSTWPAAGALNVALTTTISISLSEPPGSASINASTVRLTLDGVVVQAKLSTNNNGIHIEPVGGLERGRHYEVVLNGVADAAGNPLAAGLKFGFDTTPGRFSAPERFLIDETIGAISVAAGDLNGDGFPDLVFAARNDDFSNVPDALYFRAGRADGQFGAPVKMSLPVELLPSPTQRCPLSALAIGDLNGDGRPDLAVGSWNCGVYVLRQTPAGTLEPWQFLDERMQIVRIADINGDGRLDLVGSQNWWNKVFVYLQKEDGRLALDQMPGLGNVAGRDIAVGDMNGDGRLDLVVALRIDGNITDNIAVLYQDADGRFTVSRLLSSGLTHGIWGLAVGDFNGDGRLDIVGSTVANKPATMRLFLQAADGSFLAPIGLETLDNAQSVQAGDVNGDGRTDFVVLHDGAANVGIYLQTASGALAPEELYMEPGRSGTASNLALFDVNRDGLLDIIGPASLLRQVPLAGSGRLGAVTRGMRQTRQRAGASLDR